MLMIKYLLFDLDGTLLPMKQDEFLMAYFRGMSAHVADLGYTPREITHAIWDGSREMIKNDGSRTNEEIFWEAFVKTCGDSVLKNKASFDSFYVEGYDSKTKYYAPGSMEIDFINGGTWVLVLKRVGAWDNALSKSWSDLLNMRKV